MAADEVHAQAVEAVARAEAIRAHAAPVGLRAVADELVLSNMTVEEARRRLDEHRAAEIFAWWSIPTWSL